MALDFAAGCLGGCAGVIVGHPLDTAKVYLQTQNSVNPKYRGTMHCLREIAAKEGIRGLYKGMSSPLAGVAVINALVFGAYGNTQRRMKDPDSLTTHFVAGSLAGLVQSFLSSPMEMFKAQAQVGEAGKTPLQCLREVYRKRGLRGVYRGLGVTIVREIPACGSYFWTYEYLSRNDSAQPVSTATMLMAGGVAGSVSWLVVYPVDVLKSRVQIDGMRGEFKYKNSMDCLRKSLAAEGSGFLVRGLVPALVRAFPTNAACFTVVTWTLRIRDSEFKFNFPQTGVDKKFFPRYEEAITAFASSDALAF